MKSISYLLSSIFLTFLIASCNHPNEQDRMERDVSQKLKKLFDEPNKLDNFQANKQLIRDFSDSGSFNSENKKEGEWVEYKIEDILDGVPFNVVSNSGDSKKVRMTQIVKRIGVYDNGQRIGEWNKFILRSKEAPFRWKKNGLLY